MAEVNYTLTSSLGKYYVTNNEALPINYSLTKDDGCGEITPTISGSIEVGVTYEIPLTEDGYYTLDLVSTEFIDTSSFVLFVYFNNLHSSMIEDIFTVLCPCDCGCAGCIDLSTDQCQTLLTARSKIDVYKYSVAPQYDSPMREVHKGAACLITPQLYCDIATEGVTGSSQYNETLTKQLIALDYLAMYFWDLDNITDQEEIDYINDKYKAEEILCCISKLGIDINKIKQIIEDMATGTINAGAYQNLPPNDVGPFSINIDNRGTHIFTVSDFTQAPFDINLPNPNDLPNNALSTVRVTAQGGTAPVGELKLGGVLQTTFPFDVLATELNANQFTYTAPDQDAIDDDTIDFEISNVGAPTLFTS